jgi:hypothetical protein
MVLKIKHCLLLPVAMITFSCNNATQEAGNYVEVKTADTVSSVPAANETAPVATTTPYQNQLEFEKIIFTITSPQSATANTFTVAPSGFTISNDTLTMDCEGTVVQSEVSDLDGDNSPELLVVSETGADKKRKAYVFSGNSNKSMSMVNLPDFSTDSKNAKGYGGHDEFAFVESTFSHRFPLFENGKPLNKTRQFQYKLKPGEAMKQLKLDKNIVY